MIMSKVLLRVEIKQITMSGGHTTAAAVPVLKQLYRYRFVLMKPFQYTEFINTQVKNDKVIYGPSLHIIIISTALHFYRNITESLAKLKDDKELVRDDRNAYLYILFVLTFYAFSIIVLMVKYIKREREGNRYENYYAEFVERKW